uniref:centrosomal protein of 135 kDa-like n=1 Tax=Doryrhamphus excisus TaxID=161450 RepID=UPI0025AEAF56|nr:centrosomal protein of 135 kDa-like [Doryrhamphus excisus]XP_057930229.1 centrosomal protein of 135 kDa-like [Doryrhamphus excisus]XP_057930231.1 centrosomal protein of 135 kDa-like [Doryrhamphus excisus]
MQANEAIPTPLHPPPPKSAHPASRPEGLYVADGSQQVTNIKCDLEKAHGCIKLLITQVAERDKEIEGLNHALHAERSRDVVSLEAQNNTNKKVIAYLNLQIEYLQESNKMLEQKLSELQQKFSDEMADLSLKNFELCREVAHKTNMVKQTQMDKKRGLSIAYRKLYNSKEVILDQQEVIKDLEDNLIRLRAETPEMSPSGFIGLDRIVDLEKAVQSLEKERLDLRSQLSLLKDSKRDAETQMDIHSASHLQNAVEATVAQQRITAYTFSEQQGAPNNHVLKLASLSKQLDNAEEVTGLKDTQNKECIVTKDTMLEDDLTRQKQFGQQVEMEDVLHERNELKLQVSSYITTVSRIASQLKTKEQENLNLLERLQKAHSDIQERDQRLQQAEDLKSAIYLELHKTKPAALLSELASARKLNAKLNSDGELAACHFTFKSMELQLAKDQLEDAHSEVQQLKKQLETQKLTLPSTTLQNANKRESKIRFLRDGLIPADNMTGDCGHRRQGSQLQGRVCQPQTKINSPDTRAPAVRPEQHVTFKD